MGRFRDGDREVILRLIFVAPVVAGVAVEPVDEDDVAGPLWVLVTVDRKHFVGNGRQPTG
jgi:hypothetical protein